MLYAVCPLNSEDGGKKDVVYFIQYYKLIAIPFNMHPSPTYILLNTIFIVGNKAAGHYGPFSSAAVLSFTSYIALAFPNSFAVT